MDEAARVLKRLERIHELDRADGRGLAQTRQLLDELRALVVEAEAWARVEGDERARAAATELAASVGKVEEVVSKPIALA
jgi:hypothetical protein